MDRLRTFLAAEDEGSFTAAGRKLRRAQSVVSHTLANREPQVGFALFDRSGRAPWRKDSSPNLPWRSTSRARSRRSRRPCRPSTDASPPPRCACTWRRWGGGVQPLLDGRCRIAVIGSFPDIPPGCASEYLAAIPSALVAAPGHPLAKIEGTVSRVALSKHVQLVLTGRSLLTAGRAFGLMSLLVWRLADLGAKHAFLRAGRGWDGMPLYMVEQDLADGSLVQLRLKAHPLLGTAFSMHAAWLKDQPPGPAGRWFVDQLKCDSA